MSQQQMTKPNQVLENPIEDALRAAFNIQFKREVAYQPSAVFHRGLGIKFELVQSLTENERFRLANSGELRHNPGLNQLSVVITKPEEATQKAVKIDFSPGKHSFEFGGYKVQVVNECGDADLFFTKERRFWFDKSTRVSFVIFGRGNDPYYPGTPISIAATCSDGALESPESEMNGKNSSLYLTPTSQLGEMPRSN